MISVTMQQQSAYPSECYVHSVIYPEPKQKNLVWKPEVFHVKGTKHKLRYIIYTCYFSYKILEVLTIFW